MTDRIHTRIDPDLKQDVSNILNQLGLSESDAIRMFYNQIKLYQGLPFDVRVPNKETLQAFDESDYNKDTLKKYDDFNEFAESLK